MNAGAEWQLLAIACALAIYASAALVAVIVPRSWMSFVYPVCAAAAVVACAADLSAFIAHSPHAENGFLLVDRSPFDFRIATL